MIYFAKGISLLILANLLAQQAFAADSNTNNNMETSVARNKYQNRRLLVRYKDGTSNNQKDNVHFSVGAYVVQSFNIPQNLDVVEVAKGISLDAAEEFYREDPRVLYVEPDAPLHAFFEPPPSGPTPPAPPPETAVDPRYHEQWGLNNDGQTGGIADADINAPQMWDGFTTGDKNIVVAVIDTGVNYNHPDLKNNIWVNPGEIPGNNIDDDNNGVIDDIHGFNAIDNTGDPMDDHGHGSHCSGIIGAEAQNRDGGRGVMQKVSIIGCKFLSESGGGTTSGAVACLDYLLQLKTRSEYPVDIIATSNSWGGGPWSDALRDAIKAHQDLGILFIAAASNEGEDNDSVDTYPADYPLANIISVAATNSSDEKAWFSNYGKRTVHVGAPGEDILSTVLGHDYEMMSGTSMATPFVTGLAGAIKAYNPSLNYIKIKNLIMAGGTPVEALEGKTVSGRRIRAVDTNGQGSLTCENQIVSGRLSPAVDNLLVPVGQTVVLSAININCAEPNGDITVPMITENKVFTLIDKGEGMDSAAGDGLYTREWVAERPGTYEFVFPGNDIVVVNVYDPSNMKAYTYNNETEFNYRQIEGAPLDAQDDWATTIATPFAIHFGGSEESFRAVTVNSNGVLSLTNTHTVDMTNGEFPATDFVTLIAPYWDDLNPGVDESDVYYATLGEAPNREFVVEWRNVPHYQSADGATFQVVFFENSPDVLFNYLDLDFGEEVINNGASATIGIQTTSDKFIQVSYDYASVQSNTGIRFSLSASDEANPTDPPVSEESPVPPELRRSR